MNAGLNVELLIFDLDGTLIDSATDLTNSINFMRKQWGLQPLSVETVCTLIGDGAHMLVKRAMEESRRTAEEIPQALQVFLDHYREHLLDTTTLYPGVTTVLPHFKDKILALLSNKPTELTHLILKGLAIEDHFTFVFGGDSFPKKKPDPIGVKYILDLKKIQPSHALIIGDTKNDVMTGRNANIWTCGVTYGLGGKQAMAAHPDFVIDDIRQLLDIIT